MTGAVITAIILMVIVLCMAPLRLNFIPNDLRLFNRMILAALCILLSGDLLTQGIQAAIIEKYDLPVDAMGMTSDELHDVNTKALIFAIALAVWLIIVLIMTVSSKESSNWYYNDSDHYMLPETRKRKLMAFGASVCFFLLVIIFVIGFIKFKKELDLLIARAGDSEMRDIIGIILSDYNASKKFVAEQMVFSCKDIIHVTAVWLIMVCAYIVYLLTMLIAALIYSVKERKAVRSRTNNAEPQGESRWELLKYYPPRNINPEAPAPGHSRPQRARRQPSNP